MRKTFKMFGFALTIAKQTQSNTVDHARRELKAAGYDPAEKDGPNRWIQDNLIELLEVFSSQGHSGFSAGYCVSAFEKLARFEPLVPLAGTDDEWVEVGYDINDGTLYQNARCSRVFKNDSGEVWDIDGKVFRDSNGCCYTSYESRVRVTFPYTPTTEYVDVPAEG